tara:strand:+ start:37874 stop:38494 length:621 start_codon:yes stop_codon:yes gene_type:complete
MAILPASASEENLIWSPADGENLTFEVLRKGKPFGRHEVRFAREDDVLTVENEIELEVKFGPFRAFYYSHDSVETWKDGQLMSLDGETRKDGDDLVLSVSASGDQLEIEGTNFDGTAPVDIIPSSHWNMKQIFSETILSSEGGKLLDIKVEKLGTETLNLSGGRSIKADHYRLVSDLTVDLWYDQDGRWVKCAFEARGQTIEYILQ